LKTFSRHGPRTLTTRFEFLADQNAAVWFSASRKTGGLDTGC
jgi:hypothetical protein